MVGVRVAVVVVVAVGCGLKSVGEGLLKFSGAGRQFSNVGAAGQMKKVRRQGKVHCVGKSLKSVRGQHDRAVEILPLFWLETKQALESDRITG
jgi:hypothetical protein